ncbi:endonuclease/exonuclease/phosphatase family protein [Aliikangiella sp. IMCC44359]|uniref:endonuclease/exonuclease/phosphatase family protein n=1 Tax=Aliikangiella sp. IMCC44359 TaxID=3459125 RepID=UPI00403AB928
MKLKAISFLSLLLVHCIACADVTVGVWNIENLSPTVKRGFPELRGSKQHKPRSEEQLDKIANYIKNDLKASALMLTEIHGDQDQVSYNRSSQLDHIEENLGSNWKYWLGKSGGKQRIAFLYDTSIIEVIDIQELEVPPLKVQGTDIYHRDPLLAHIRFKDGGNDLFMVGLHLKSVQTNVHNHMAAVSKLLGILSDTKGRKSYGLPTLSEENEVIVMGDLNDSSHDDPNFKFIFDYFKGAGYKHLGDADNYPDTRVNGSEIDHILVSKKLKAEVVSGSFKVHTVPDSQRKSYRKIYSDHFPITVALKTHEDTDG